MTVRHILIEDNRDEPFANAAAIFVPGPEVAPSYTAMQLMTGTLAGGVVPATTGNPQVQAFATLGDDGQDAAVVVVRSHPIAPAGVPRAVDVTLPPGQWDVEVFTLGAPSLLASNARVSFDQAQSWADDGGRSPAQRPGQRAGDREVAMSLIPIVEGSRRMADISRDKPGGSPARPSRRRRRR